MLNVVSANGVEVTGDIIADTIELAASVTASYVYASNLYGKVFDQGGNVFNVKSYGAVGDGVANDTAPG